MTWPVLLSLVFALGLALLIAWARRAELRRMEDAVRDRDRAVRQGSEKAQLQHPVVDLSRCLGCGTCVAVCPEDGVLELVHGQAMVVNGARCMGISACERECPVSAITVTLTDLEDRNDIPALSEGLEAVGSPGLFLAGEVTAHALIKTAIEHGTAVGAEVARRVGEDPGASDDVLDLLVVGAGPAGIACALEATRHGLHYLLIEQEDGVGGTVAKYPRRKLVMTQPVDMPIHGRLKRTSYSKEQLMELWEGLTDEYQLQVQGSQVFKGLERTADGHFVVRTETDAFTARNVCLAIGRRGIPRKLDVPGEDLPKVAYSLLDAHSYQGRRILVVGGGDSAVETAMGLAEQPGNEVTLSYRRDGFFRIRAKNEERLAQCLEQGKLTVLYESQVVAIRPDSVELAVRSGAAAAASPVLQPAGVGGGGGDAGANWLGVLEGGGSAAVGGGAGDGGVERYSIPNDDVFVMAGGVPPFELLQHSGVSFDSSLIEAPGKLAEQGTGLIRALTAGFLLSLGALLWAVWHGDYYSLPIQQRAAHEKHGLLRPGLGLGLWLGIASTVMIVVNLAYLLRKSPRVRFNFGSLQKWMTSHVATGILALLCAILHGGMITRDAPGGHAFYGLVILLITGAIGRYFYSYVPRAANGRELELAEVRTRLGRVAEEWDQGQQVFRDRVRAELDKLIETQQWRSSFFGRALALIGIQRQLKRVLNTLVEEGREQGLSEDQVQDTVELARRANRMALMAAHYEDLRAILNTWRYLHRWVAALMVLLVIVHIVHALVYGAFFFETGR